MIWFSNKQQPVAITLRNHIHDNYKLIQALDTRILYLEDRVEAGDKKNEELDLRIKALKAGVAGVLTLMHLPPGKDASDVINELTRIRSTRNIGMKTGLKTPMVKGINDGDEE